MNKYIRNKLYKEKCYRRAKKKEPWVFYGFSIFGVKDPEELFRDYLESLGDYEKDLQRKVRYMDRGAHKGATCPPKWYVKIYNRKKRCQDKNHMRHERFDSIERDERGTAEWDWW
jgi:hypothetical protein